MYMIKEKVKFQLLKLMVSTAYVAYTTCRRSVGHSAYYCSRRNREGVALRLPWLRLRMIMPWKTDTSPLQPVRTLLFGCNGILNTGNHRCRLWRRRKLCSLATGAKANTPPRKIKKCGLPSLTSLTTLKPFAERVLV